MIATKVCGVVVFVAIHHQFISNILLTKSVHTISKLIRTIISSTWVNLQLDCLRRLSQDLARAVTRIVSDGRVSRGTNFQFCLKQPPKSPAVLVAKVLVCTATVGSASIFHTIREHVKIFGRLFQNFHMYKFSINHRTFYRNPTGSQW